uniref:Nramp1.1 n=1 Tax=Psychotria gabriellae TaxID=1162814 RepID=S6CRV1_9GENT|nr:Nramp1.1 [Psychotria gabriellae]
MAALVQIQETPSPWRKFLGFIGPGILISVAYLDPGNLETDLQAGADHKYELLWIVLIGLTFAHLIQSRSANLGVATGKHLSEQCSKEYPKVVTVFLWMFAEVAVVAADIPEVLGTAFALNLLFKVPIWAGVLLAGLSTLLLLGLQRYGIRTLEIVITTLVLIVGGCFLTVMVHARPDVKEVAMGMFIPKLSHGSAVRDAVALLGALIMPHNLFLHSALVLSRKIPPTVEGVRSASRYFFVESGLALLIAFLINLAVVSVSGSVCSNPSISSESKKHCKSITLNSAAFLLKDSLGKWSSIVYAISLLASGQSSTVTGTYAGQYIMQGFFDFRMSLWLRNLVTRSISIIPSLVVCIIGGPSGAARLIIVASMILSFVLPFALIPLLKFTSSEAKMGQHKNSLIATLVSWLLGFCSISINLYFLSTSLLGWIISNKMPMATRILAGIFIVPLMMLYMGMVAYLTLKPETPSPDPTFLDVDSNNEAEVQQRRMDCNNAGMFNDTEMGIISCS